MNRSATLFAVAMVLVSAMGFTSSAHAVKSDKSRGCHFARASWFFRRFSRRFPPLAHAHGDEVLKWCFRAASRAVSKL